MTVIKNCVIVAVDDSAASRAALRWATGYARATATDLCAVHVLDWPIGLVGPAGEPRTRLYVPARQVAESYRHRLRGVLGDAGAAFEADSASGPATHPASDPATDPASGSPLHFAQGPVGEVLVRLSAHAALLVIGTREPLRGGQRFVTGSASHYCVSHAPCPVVTVPEAPVDDSNHDRLGGSLDSRGEGVVQGDPALSACW